MATNEQITIVDSSALISLMNVADKLHIRAIAINDILLGDGWSVLVPSEVFAETLNAVGKKLGRRDATLVGRTLLARHMAGDFGFIHAEPGTYVKTLALHASGSGGPSFVDCLVMALAASYDTDCIFGFDATFRKNGYRLPGASSLTRSAT
jgi:predicted nucleic acid-binding protein